jgi:hypothetical protein
MSLSFGYCCTSIEIFIQVKNTMYPSFLEFAQSLISVRMFGLDKFASMINLDSIYSSILLLYLQNQ